MRNSVKVFIATIAVMVAFASLDGCLPEGLDLSLLLPAAIVVGFGTVVGLTFLVMEMEERGN